MHRILSGDGDKHCYACGIVVEVVSDGDTRGTFDFFQCKPGGWAHPPYVMGVIDGEPVIETCAAHPYNDCTPDAVRT